jgi:hypothetical protein
VREHCLDHLLINGECGHAYHATCFRLVCVNGRGDTSCFKDCTAQFNPHNLIEVEIQNPRPDSQSTAGNLIYQLQLEIMSRDKLILNLNEQMDRLRKQVNRLRTQMEEAPSASAFSPWAKTLIPDLLAIQQAQQSQQNQQIQPAQKPKINFDGLNPTSAPFIPTISVTMPSSMPTPLHRTEEDSDDCLVIDEQPPRIPKLVIQGISRLNTATKNTKKWHRSNHVLPRQKRRILNLVLHATNTSF